MLPGMGHQDLPSISPGLLIQCLALGPTAVGEKREWKGGRSGGRDYTLPRKRQKWPKGASDAETHDTEVKLTLRKFLLVVVVFIKKKKPLKVEKFRYAVKYSNEMPDGETQRQAGISVRCTFQMSWGPDPGKTIPSFRGPSGPGKEGSSILYSRRNSRRVFFE